MGLYLVFATHDLRTAVSATCTSFYMPFARWAVVAYEGSAEELARRLDFHRTGGPGRRVGAGHRRATAGAGVLTPAARSIIILR